MDQTAISEGESPVKPPGDAVPVSFAAAAAQPGPTPQPELQEFALSILHRLASLRITVVLFVLSLLLVFWGTLAQQDAGVWTVVNKYFRNFFVWVPWRVVFFNNLEDASSCIPFPGGLTIGGAMLINLLAAHAVRFKLAWNRAGIILIHAGIIIMMFGEVVTYLYADEGQMMIPVGHGVNHVVHVRQSELAIIQVIDEKKDAVVVVPGSMLQDGAKIQDSRLPFEIEVIEYMANSKWIEMDGKLKNRATRGMGLREIVKAAPEVSGVDPNQEVDIPSAYLRLSRGGQQLGIWLFSAWFSDSYANLVQEIKLDDKVFRVVLRYKQTNRDFHIELTNFKQENYPGTDKPKDYRSFVRLVDEKAGVDRDVQIYMNAPMTYKGETFYQQSVKTDPRTNLTVSTLQVVRNPGWVLPYLSCAVVGLGMLVHFGNTLYKFLDRRVVR